MRPQRGESGEEEGTKISGNGCQRCLRSSSLVELRLEKNYQRVGRLSTYGTDMPIMLPYIGKTSKCLNAEDLSLF